MKRPIATLVAAAALSLGLTACSDDTDSADTASPDSSASSEPDTIKLSGFGALESPAISYPEQEAGARAAIEAVNAAGGVNGRKLELLDWCNDQNDPNTAMSCVQDAVASKAVAMIGGVTQQGTAVNPILEAAGLPVIGANPISATDFSSENHFLIDGGALSLFGGLVPWALKESDAKRLAVVYPDIAAVSVYKEMIKLGAEAMGSEIVKEITIPANTLDVTPYLNQVVESDPDAFISTLTTGDLIKMWKAVEARDVDLPLYASAGSVTPDSVKAAGGAAEGTVVISQFPAISDSQMEQFRADMEKYQAGQTLGSVSQRSWAAVKVLAQILESVDGEMTRESVKSALAGAHGVNMLWLTDLSFDEPGPYAKYPRVVSPRAFASVIKGEEFQALDGEVDLKP